MDGIGNWNQYLEYLNTDHYEISPWWFRVNSNSFEESLFIKRLYPHLSPWSPTDIQFVRLCETLEDKGIGYQLAAYYIVRERDYLTDLLQYWMKTDILNKSLGQQLLKLSCDLDIEMVRYAN